MPVWACMLSIGNPRESEVHAGSCMHALDLKSQRIQFMPGHALQSAWYGISRYRSTCEYYYSILLSIALPWHLLIGESPLIINTTVIVLILDSTFEYHAVVPQDQ